MIRLENNNTELHYDQYVNRGKTEEELLSVITNSK